MLSELQGANQEKHLMTKALGDVKHSYFNNMDSIASALGHKVGGARGMTLFEVCLQSSLTPFSLLNSVPFFERRILDWKRVYGVSCLDCTFIEGTLTCRLLHSILPLFPWLYHDRLLLRCPR